MNKAWLVARREYVENLRTKTFWIGICIFPIMMAAMIGVPLWLEKTKDVRRYAVVDHSGWMLKAVEERAAFPDLIKVFREARQILQDGGDVARFPEAVRSFAMATSGDDEPTFSKRAEVFVRVLAPGVESAEMRRMVTELMREQFPELQRDKLEQWVEGIRTWWKGLDTKEARKLAPDLDRGRYRRIAIDPASLGDDPELALNGMIDSGELFAYFVVEEDPVNDDGECRYVSNNQTDNSLKRWFTKLVNEEVRERRFLAKGIGKKEYRDILRPVPFRDRMVGAGGRTVRVDIRDKARQFAPLIFAYALWIAVFSVAQMLLTNTVEEKSNRIIEVLLSSVSPLQLMAGKIAGIAITGLTLVSSWAAFTFVGIKFGPSLLGRPLPFDLTFILQDPLFLSSFLAYFLLGYLFYSAFLVGLGSVCNSLKEAQNLMQPIMLIMIVPLLAIFPIAQDPNGALARLLSWIPPFTPFIMMNRAAGPPSALEYALTGTLMVVSIALALWAAAKVFRIGILMTGKRPRLFEILRWLRTPVGALPASGESPADAAH